ncbi:hypothetical protein DF3PA_80039 [Candidatus Defluviicoccus seviourii]|uniref:Chromosomal replication initiator DnaA C-terminal domain-containing protein n=1 Tax=Candidatus Defluviicoccus seviourii TaxID=2565273 RepID=A0A564WIG7_9PROT|nr:hypothetical protein DF3PA_80039 [Candidatus Defluviicoccus seviourii]
MREEAHGPAAGRAAVPTAHRKRFDALVEDIGASATISELSMEFQLKACVAAAVKILSRNEDGAGGEITPGIRDVAAQLAGILADVADRYRGRGAVQRRTSRRGAATITAVAVAFDVSEAAILSDRQDRAAVLARQAVCLLLHDAGWTLGRIGRLISRDHTTIGHAVKRAEHRAARHLDFARRSGDAAEAVRAEFEAALAHQGDAS